MAVCIDAEAGAVSFSKKMKTSKYISIASQKELLINITQLSLLRSPADIQLNNNHTRTHEH
jgi:hypothetical protein